MAVQFDIPEGAVNSDAPVTPEGLAEAESIIGMPLPPSFRQWLLKFGDVKYVDGVVNLRFNQLLPQDEEHAITSIARGARALQNAQWPVDDRFIVFGSDGMDMLFALYRPAKVGDECPVVGVSFEGYVLMASSFEAFVNTCFNYELWRSGGGDDLLDFDDAPGVEREAELLAKYDPKMEPGTICNMYERAQPIETIEGLVADRLS